MKQFFIILLVAASVVVSGCAVKSGNGHRAWVIMPQVGAIVKVVNNCSSSVTLESMDDVVLQNMPFSESATIPMPSRAFSGYNRNVSMTVKAFDAKGQYLGSSTKIFFVNIYEGSRDEVWVVDRLESPPGARCTPP